MHYAELGLEPGYGLPPEQTPVVTNGCQPTGAAQGAADTSGLGPERGEGSCLPAGQGSFTKLLLERYYGETIVYVHTELLISSLCILVFNDIFLNCSLKYTSVIQPVFKSVYLHAHIFHSTNNLNPIFIIKMTCKKF